MTAHTTCDVRRTPIRYNMRMLFILTGDIQTGKTRWLERVLGTLRSQGVQSAGVLAPGVWSDHGPDAAPRYEKLGIDNVLLPENTRIPFARRLDLARVDGDYDENSQAARAQLAWAIDDEALARVNEHFDFLEKRASEQDAHTPTSLLVVDELGRLELLRGEGLVSAMRMLDSGATPAFPHALVIVRADLLEIALQHFAAVPWNGTCAIGPNDEGEKLLVEACSMLT